MRLVMPVLHTADSALVGVGKPARQARLDSVLCSALPAARLPALPGAGSFLGVVLLSGSCTQHGHAWR